MSRTVTILTSIGGLLALSIWFVYPLARDAYNPTPDTEQSHCRGIGTGGDDPSRIPRPDEKIKIISLDNHGNFINRCQLTDALFELNWDMPRIPSDPLPPVKTNAQILPKLVVLYIHGWKHNADPFDKDLISFSKMIGNLRIKQAGKKNIVGIYIGWNAKLGLGILDNLTFWEKESIADRIAQSGVVTKIVSSIGAITKRNDQRIDQFIAIGHSFGARILFSAVSQNLIYETEKSHPGHYNGKYKIITSSADGIILLNPAFEAARYQAIADVSRDDEHFDQDQNPLLISISSETDWATKTAFPIGAWLSLERDSKERTTLGNYEPFMTHHLTPTSEDGCLGKPGLSTSDSFRARNICLMRDRLQGVVQDHNPFIISEADKKVINGHNEIWNDIFSAWLFDFVDALGNSVARSKSLAINEQKEIAQTR